MIFRQLFDSTSSTYTYIIASRKGGEALMIDPVFERTDQYLRLLEELNLAISYAPVPLHARRLTPPAGVVSSYANCVV